MMISRHPFPQLLRKSFDFLDLWVNLDLRGSAREGKRGRRSLKLSAGDFCVGRGI
jgi:hypothetical protein